MEESLEMREPKFLQDLHTVRKKLSKRHYGEYEVRQRRALEEYSKELGHLYVES